MPRVLSPEEQALWRRVTADIGGRKAAVAPQPTTASGVREPAPLAASARPRQPIGLQTLDKRWDRDLATGTIAPDRTVDLHGCTLQTAHRRALSALDAAVCAGDRVVVLVTGKPPKPGSSRLDAPLRGLIRASIGDWIAASPLMRHVAAIRPAHRRHGGAGALYVVLRRENRARG